MIKYQDGEIIFADGYRCKPTDIISVNYYNGTDLEREIRVNPDGWLHITTKDKTIKYHQVEAVRDACNRLKYYMQTSTAEDTEQLSKNKF